MKRIGRFFLRLGLQARLMLVIGVLAFVRSQRDPLPPSPTLLNLRKIIWFLRTSTTHSAVISTVISRMGKFPVSFRIRSFTRNRAS